MRPAVRLTGLSALALGLSRGWTLLQEWRFASDARRKAEADLIAARDLDAHLVGERADHVTAGTFDPPKDAPWT